MHTLWSEHVQGIQTLYLSRKLRFDDRFSGQYQTAFRLEQDKPIRILEIGCGPGALAEALRRWYPDAEITGIDRDSAFVAYAKQHVENVTFLEGDATALPFPDGFFDVTVSNTVSEHIEPSAFWGEQFRVLKPGGVCLCLSARRGIRCTAACLEQTEEEKRFWEGMPDMETDFERYQVCRYPMSESELPAAMEKAGFRGLSTGYAVADLTPDDPKYPNEMAEAMIEADRMCDLESVQSAHAADAEDVTDAINRKYDERLRLYRNGIRLWDTSVSLTMILRGERPLSPDGRKDDRTVGTVV
ncbi:MAG: class I SAM-dependent methyltransferase [Clostridia bacterium]|nr:class I SAM-dependent methyltransferase [Clostridia bacterium]